MKPNDKISILPHDSADSGALSDVDAVMKKYDRESNVRLWDGTPKFVIRALMALFSVYCIYTTLTFRGLREITLTAFLAMILIIGYLNYPARKRDVRVNYMPWYDILIMLAGSASLFYYTFHAAKIVRQSTAITKQPLMVAMAVIAILALMELCRRSVGVPILCVVGALLVYTLSTTRFQKALYDMYYAKTGIMNTPIDVCAKYIVVFIIFGAFLERTGISNFFIQLANCVAGASAGGPAKVAVISSALCGMVSGSSVGNTVTTGSVTIPMMKRTGYRGDFAGAVEAAASTGGQIMPPIMGAAAFLMAEYMGVSYAKVALTAVLPAVLYFTGIYIAVHLEARKLGLKGIPKEQLPEFRVLVKKIYLLLPLVVLVWLVSTSTRSMAYSAAVAILVTIVVGVLNGFFYPEEKLTAVKFVDALEAGARGTITVAVACAMAGIVAGCITSTGLASRLITAIVSVSGGKPMIALFLTMLCCIVLGMGVPTTANYCIMAATCAPILTNPAIGIPRMAAHFFVFYFGIVADITPPVALAAYAGSAIAKAPPMRTAFNATRLAIAAFIVPYIFALNPAMLLVDVVGWQGVLEAALIVVTSLIGLFGVAAALNGYLFRPIHPLFRVLIAAGGLAMMVPGILTDVIGLVAVGAVVAVQHSRK
ncbi:MAG: TRAP transporter permease [Oscillibacter sp.]|nr:TRAP transporter permease [Oscillibacter sp.]